MRIVNATEETLGIKTEVDSLARSELPPGAKGKVPGPVGALELSEEREGPVLLLLPDPFSLQGAGDPSSLDAPPIHLGGGGDPSSLDAPPIHLGGGGDPSSLDAPPIHLGGGGDPSSLDAPPIHLGGGGDPSSLDAPPIHLGGGGDPSSLDAPPIHLGGGSGADAAEEGQGVVVNRTNAPLTLEIVRSLPSRSAFEIFGTIETVEVLGAKGNRRLRLLAPAGQ